MLKASERGGAASGEGGHGQGVAAGSEAAPGEGRMPKGRQSPHIGRRYLRFQRRLAALSGPPSMFLFASQPLLPG